MIRSFEVGDGPALAAAWTAAAPADPIGYPRFRDLFLLDRNFDAAGLKVAVVDNQIVGAAYAVRRLIAVDAVTTSSRRVGGSRSSSCTPTIVAAASAGSC